MSEYLKIVFQNLEPVRISDDSTSQSGQTVTLRYIPGSVLRGVVVNALSKEDDFETIKKSLLSPGIRFLNAYPTDERHELLPSPKGFYENKLDTEGKKELENVVIDGSFTEGNKRAALGRFCRMDDTCVYFYNVDTGSDLKIKINLEEGEKQNVFRNEYIGAGYVFTGYIAVDDVSLKERLKAVFQTDMIIGNSRSAGLGKCKVLTCEYTDKLPYEAYLPGAEQEKECYMMLLSNSVMRDEKGELCGLDCKKLGSKLGVDGLEIKYCATSTVDVKGYNRIWKNKIPSDIMYEQGSVFHLKYKGMLTPEKMRALCDEGIGIRRNEGFGRVLFLNGYPNIKFKEKQELKKCPVSEVVQNQYEEDADTLKLAARCYYRNLIEKAMNRYVVEHPLEKGMVANSQLGMIEAFATAYKYEPGEAERSIKSHLEHALDKEENVNVQKDRQSIRKLRDFVLNILKEDLEATLEVKTKCKERVMGIAKSDLFTEDELLKMKLSLITKLIRYDNKKEEA